jgi:UDP-glucose 4-epimerase
MRFLIFGGAGYLGSHLVDLLDFTENEIVVFDNRSGNISTSFSSNVKFVFGDITNPASVKELDQFGKFDGVFHLAALKSVEQSFLRKDAYALVNETGTVNIAKYCKDKGIRNIVFSSSAAVYGALDSPTLISEDDLTKPINPYGLNKLNAENVLRELSASSSINVMTLRLFNLVGAAKPEYNDLRGENVLPVIARKLMGGELFKVFGNSYPTTDGTCVRDYINVLDVAMAHVMAMNFLIHNKFTGSSHTLNVCSGTGFSILELITLVNKVNKNHLSWVFGNERLGDPASVIGDNSRAKETLGWIPKIKMETSITESLSLGGTFE